MNFIHVIIPVYNAKSYLGEAVFSVLNQPYKGIKIILVDDGSTDGSGKLCDKLAAQEKRISVIHKKNAGVSSARNAGINFVLSEGMALGYIAFLDADDLWCQNVINEDIISKLEKNNNAEQFSEPICHDEQLCIGGKDVIWPMQGHFCANIYSLKLFRSWDIRFIEGLKYSEDKILKMQCVFLAEMVMYLPEILHIYRENNNSAMRKVFLYSPLDYYLPIINGWIESDNFINSKAEKSLKYIDAGYTLASIYFGDMAVEHFKRWKSRQVFDYICNSHPYFYLFVNMDPKAVSVKQYRNQQMFFKHPVVFTWKYRTIGLFEYLFRLILRIKPVYKIRIKQRYPLEKIPSIH